MYWIIFVDSVFEELNNKVMKTNEVPQQYISKSALVTELERIEHETNYEPFTDEVLGKRCTCKSLLSFINTLEVKEVNLEKEIDSTYRNYVAFGKQEIAAVAEHFFKLGLKVAQKGEEV